MDIVIKALVSGHSGFAKQFGNMVRGLKENKKVDRLKLIPEMMSNEVRKCYKNLLETKMDPEKSILIDTGLAHNYLDDTIVYKLRIGVSELETDRISLSWMNSCNSMDAIITPTNFNVKTYTKSGVVVPIKDIFTGCFEYEIN